MASDKNDLQKLLHSFPSKWMHSSSACMSILSFCLGGGGRSQLTIAGHLECNDRWLNSLLFLCKAKRLDPEMKALGELTTPSNQTLRCAVCVFLNASFDCVTDNVALLISYRHCYIHFYLTFVSKHPILLIFCLIEKVSFGCFSPEFNKVTVLLYLPWNLSISLHLDCISVGWRLLIWLSTLLLSLLTETKLYPHKLNE